MQVRGIMTPGVETIRADETLAEAAGKMRDLNVGLIPVVDGTSLVGMLTDRDVTVRATAEAKDPSGTPVREVMTTDTIYCYDDQDVLEASQLMQKHQIRRLLVLDR